MFRYEFYCRPETSMSNCVCQCCFNVDEHYEIICRTKGTMPNTQIFPRTHGPRGVSLKFEYFFNVYRTPWLAGLVTFLSLGQAIPKTYHTKAKARSLQVPFRSALNAASIFSAPALYWRPLTPSRISNNVACWPARKGSIATNSRNTCGIGWKRPMYIFLP